MIEKRLGEKKCSFRGMYIQNNLDILPKWKDIRGIVDMPKLGESNVDDEN